MLDIIKFYFDGMWALVQIKYPGTDLSIAAIGIGALCVVVSLRLLGAVTGFHFDGGGFSRIVRGDIKGGNSKNIKVSNERSGDEH